MKTNKPDGQDEALRSLLQEWRPDASLPPRFQGEVWRRINHATMGTLPPVWTVIVQWVSTALARPALAASYVALLLAVGVTAGWAQAQQETSQIKNDLSQRYVSVLNPYQASRN